MNALQLSIMRIVDVHSHVRDCPVSLGEIVIELEDAHVSKATVKYSIRALIKSGYLRRAVIRSNTVSYVQLRSLSKS